MKLVFLQAYWGMGALGKRAGGMGSTGVTEQKLKGGDKDTQDVLLLRKSWGWGDPRGSGRGSGKKKQNVSKDQDNRSRSWPSWKGTNEENMGKQLLGMQKTSRTLVKRPLYSLNLHKKRVRPETPMH